jgi:Tol biopolymer transport system component
VFTYAVADGTERQLTHQGWHFASRVQWLPDMTSLIVAAGGVTQNAQLWNVNYPDGKARRITNDLSVYRAIGLTADGKKFSTVQADGLVNVWIVPDGDASRAVSLPTGNIGFYTAVGTNVSWTPEGKIVFASNEGGNVDIWSMDPDGSNKKQLTASGAVNLSPVVSPDGRYILYVSTVDGRRSIWRMDANGSNQIKLTNGSADQFPSFSPDGQWVIYCAYDGPKPTAWKVPINGGAPTQLIDHVVTNARVSPDGKLLAYLYPQSPDPFAPPNKLSIVQLDGQGETRTFDLLPMGTVTTVMEWAKDSRAVMYTANFNSVTNIWSQTVDGGTPKQITTFKDSLMSGFSFSRDGKQLVCTRGRLLRDAVLITDLK